MTSKRAPNLRSQSFRAVKLLAARFFKLVGSFKNQSLSLDYFHETDGLNRTAVRRRCGDAKESDNFFGLYGISATDIACRPPVIRPSKAALEGGVHA